MADPSPVFVWRFRGERISTIANKYEIVSNNSVSTLTVVGVGGSDEGEYNCSVSNRFGPDSTSAIITILGIVYTYITQIYIHCTQVIPICIIYVGSKCVNLCIYCLRLKCERAYT